MYKISFDQIKWETFESGIRSKTYIDGSTQLRLLEFGQDLVHPDWCVNGHQGFVIEGELEIEFENQVIRLQEGDGLSIPTGESDKHRPKAISPKVRLIFFENI